MVSLFPRAKYDGVVGMWYGKAPGVDRASDAFRHGNFVGVGRNGGVLCIAGDDPACKSSTLPSATEQVFADAMFPVVYPGSVQEVLDLGRHGIELSRYSGLWVGMKMVADVADGRGRHGRGVSGPHCATASSVRGRRPTLPAASGPDPSAAEHGEGGTRDAL
jgi:indolepyruvate ferredoxin oxidoreductase